MIVEERIKIAEECQVDNLELYLNRIKKIKKDYKLK